MVLIVCFVDTFSDKMITNEALSGVPLLLVANKQDIPESLSLKRIQDIFLSSGEMIGNREYHSVSASALKGDGVNESIEWTVRSIKRNVINRPPHESDDWLMFLLLLLYLLEIYI